MTGKELLLVLVGAATAAGAGGMAAATLMGRPPADDAQQTAVLERLDALGAALEDTNAILERSRDEIGGLRGRMEAAEAGLYGARAAPAPGSGRRRVDVTRHGAPTAEDGAADGEAAAADDALRAGVTEALEGLSKELTGLRTGGGSPQLGTLFSGDGRVADMTGALEGLQRSFRLRNLPEEERWEKAREEVGLNDVQIDEIKAALDERDQAIDESMVVERDDEDGSSRISVRRMDLAKTREANDAYRKRVDNVLNDEQKKAWKDKGYENAFGRGAMGTATVISIGTITSDGAETK